MKSSLLAALRCSLLLLVVVFSCGQSYAQSNVCSSAPNITTGPTCTATTAQTVVGATYTTPTTVPLCGTPTYDVWYKFTASSDRTVITLSNVGTGFLTPQIQVISNSCGTGASVYGCGPSPLTATGLTPGTVYLVRIFSTVGAAPATTALGKFDICLTDLAPSNDNCSGATVITSAATCTNTTGTLYLGTNSPTLTAGCGSTSSADVWYSFVAASAYPAITLSSVGASLTGLAKIQLYNAGVGGTCVGVTDANSIGCASGNVFQTDTIVGGAGLIVGNTYYIRVYSSSAGPFTATGTAWAFNICVTNNINATVPTVKYGKSYVNITKGVNGGTVEPGDTLEMRVTFFIQNSGAYNVSAVGSIPTNTSFVPGSIRILTNEGQLYKQWTDAADADPGTVSGSTVTINLGKGASGTNTGGTVKNTYRPSVFGSQCLIVAAYRVKVTGAYGSTVNVGGGTLSYTIYTTATPVVSNVTFPAVNIMVYQNSGICVNSVGTNGITSETGGTFGNDNAKNRTYASPNIPPNYKDTVLGPSSPPDNYYGISNNTSAGGMTGWSIIQNDPTSAKRIFGGYWDVIGDHTGATNSLVGNPPTDTTGGKKGGYMITVNAAFSTDTAYLDTVKNLCPNTYYEYSAWFRNLCKRCSGDSTGVGYSNSLYIPTGPGDTSGVHPNLSFNINGYDYYTTGDILYQGTTGGWLKKGFTYLTGASQTQMIISIRNNAPGGGGNDWAMDDVGVATCSPSLNLNPTTSTVTLCYGNATTLSATVSSYFNNYTQYIWEKSINNGVSYTPVGFSGTGFPVLTSGHYDYTAAGPNVLADTAANHNIYRIRVATTSTNLADPLCSFSAIRTVQVLTANCQWLLKADLISFTGNLQNNVADVQWSMVNEVGRESYEIEKSTDGVTWTSVGKVSANAQGGSNTYSFNDPAAINGVAYYRIKITDDAQYKYSKTILLSSGKIDFAVKDLVNPFVNNISCNVIVPADGGNLHTTILDMYGRVVKTYTQQSARGVTPLKIQDIGSLSGGTYFLKVEWQNQSITKKIIKAN